jgi:hypothetical protein
VCKKRQTPQPEPEAQPPQPEPEPEAEHQGIGLIMEFDPLVHVVADPALRKPIGRFHPNIQYDVSYFYFCILPCMVVGAKIINLFFKFEVISQLCIKIV